jgi:ABC-2 type transport system permease protein
MLQSAWTLARKDTLAFLRDRTALFLTLLVPIALVTVFGWIMAYAFGGSGGMPRVELQIADLASSTSSQRLVERLKKLELLKVKTVDVAGGERDSDVEEPFRKLIRDGDAHHVLVIPATFDQDLRESRVPTLTMLRDPGRQMEEQVIQIALMQAVIPEFGEQLWPQVVENMLLDQGISNEEAKTIQSWMDSLGTRVRAYVLARRVSEGVHQHEPPTVQQAAESGSISVSRRTGNGSLSEAANDDAGVDPDQLFQLMKRVLPVTMADVQPPDRAMQVTYQQAQSVAGMTVMMLLFALTSCGSVLLVERESGMLRRLFSQPIPRSSILLGKFLFACMVGGLQMFVLFVYGELMFRVGLFRDPVTLVVLSVTWIATGAAFGLFLAAFCKTSKQAESLASLLVLVMAALGGCWFPLQLMSLPVALETICKSTMTYWAMTGFQSMLWNQLPWYSSKIFTALAVQWGWATGLALLAILFFRRNYCRG